MKNSNNELALKRYSILKPYILKEKNLTELLFKLKRAYVNSSKKKVDIDELRKILYSTFTIDSPFVQESEAEPEEEAQDEKHFENPLKDNFVADEIILGLLGFLNMSIRFKR